MLFWEGVPGLQQTDRAVRSTKHIQKPVLMSPISLGSSVSKLQHYWHFRKDHSFCGGLCFALPGAEQLWPSVHWPRPFLTAGHPRARAGKCGPGGEPLRCSPAKREAGKATDWVWDLTRAESLKWLQQRVAERRDESNVRPNKEGPAEVDNSTAALGEEGLHFFLCSMYMRNGCEITDGLPSTAHVQQGPPYKWDELEFPTMAYVLFSHQSLCQHTSTHSGEKHTLFKQKHNESS